MGLYQYFAKLPVFQELTPRLLGMYMFLSMGAINFGVDNNYWSGMISLPQFIKDRGDCVDGTCTLPSSWLSAGSGTPNAGLAIGAMIAGPVIEKLGRRYTVGVICALAFIGMIIQNAVPSYWGIMAGRIINGVSMGLEANNIPMYMAELSPPSIRGSMVNFYQWWLFIGAIIAKVVIFKSNDAWPNSQWAWRTILVVQFAVPVILIGVMLYLPESPRYLIKKGRLEEARKSLAFIRRGAATEEEIDQELNLTAQAAEEQYETHRAGTYLDCFRGTNGRRLMIATIVQLIEQFAGNGYMSSYAVIFMKQVGITDPLKSNIARTCMGLAGSTLAFFFSDKFGRRPLMIATALGMWAGLWIISGLIGYNPGGVHGGLAEFSLFLLLMWSLFSNLGWGSCVWIVTAETPTLQLREKSISLATTFSFVGVLFISYVSPFIQGDPGFLGAKIGFIWGSFSLFGAFFVYFCVPELSGRSLEELDELFNEKVSARHFKDYVCTGIGAQLTAVEDSNANAGKHIVNGKVGENSTEDVTPDSKTIDPTVTAKEMV